jgi:hypothetical protein
VLVRQEEDGAIVIGQLSHAWLAGQLARAWGNERFGAVEPREEVVLGAEQHDIGWALFDLRPSLNHDTGFPRSFLELSVDEHLSIWRGAPEHLLSQSLHAALVVSMHGRALSQLRVANAPEPDPRLLAHIAEEGSREDELRAKLGISEAQAERTQRQMWAWDSLSLALCNAWRPFAVHEVPSAEGAIGIELCDGSGGACILDPWPFSADPVEVRCEARRLEQPCTSERALRRALERAQPLTLTFQLRAP